MDPAIRKVKTAPAFSSSLPEIVWGDFSPWKSANTVLPGVLLEGENKGTATSLAENLSSFAWRATKKKIIFVQL